MKNSIYIHVGYGRTGTTWLQNQVFPSVSGIQYLGKTEESYPDWMLNWNYLDRLLLASEIDTIQNNLNVAREKSNVLISSEAFTQTGGVVDQIDRIKAVTSDSKIILVIRDPADLVVSRYRYLIEAGFFSDSIDHYLDYTSRPFDLVRRKRLYLYDFVYPLVIEKLIQEFGSQNTLVIKYECLVKEPQKFVGTILRYLGVEETLELDYSLTNKSNENISVEPQIVNGLRSFYDSIFSYTDIPDYQLL